MSTTEGKASRVAVPVQDEEAVCAEQYLSIERWSPGGLRRMSTVGDGQEDEGYQSLSRMRRTSVSERSNTGCWSKVG